ncbi:MAG: pilus assembly protein TadG-related protein [Candidatus Acidiferrales bacterium]
MSRSNPAAGRVRNREHGMSLLWVAGGLVFILGVAALTIDLASLYVVRNEAQRAADAGALAGAKAFADSGCLSGGPGACNSFQTLATTRATSAAGQNSVGGVLVSSLPGACVSVTFPTPPPGDQLVSVTIQRTAACGNAIPTLFAKVLGFFSADVSAIATAEAYNGPNICAGCIKPFLLPNCDPVNTSPKNPSCPGSGGGYFVDPITGDIKHPGPVSSGGVIGQSWTLHWNSGPSQYYDVDVGCGNGDQRPCISGCTGAAYSCGKTLDTVQGNRVGQITQGIDALIHDNGIEGPPGPNPPQDTINTSVTPFQITGGSNNPNPAFRGQTITNSDSLVTVAIYDGHNLGPGHQTVTIVGYMQLFIRYVESNAHVTAVILGVSGCGTATPTCGSGTISGGGSSLFPIRLVRTPGT